MKAVVNVLKKYQSFKNFPILQMLLVYILKKAKDNKFIEFLTNFQKV